MDNNSNKGKLKITKEQYNRIFASGLIKESIGENNSPYVEYYKDMSGEEPFMLGNNKYQYVWAIYPSGKKDIGVYAFGQDLVYDYQVFRQMHNINEDQAPKVKGGLNRVDKEFKKAMGGKDVVNMKVTNEDMKTSKFKIQAPIKGMSQTKQGTFGKPIMEGDDQLKQETLDLIKYLYRKSDEFSPFWGENDLTYDDICDALEASKLVIKKDGAYELSKTLGSPEKAIAAVEEELRAMLGNDKTPKDELEEGDWFDNHPDHPANQPDPQYSRGTHVKNPQLHVIGYNGEFALVKGEDGTLYAFYYDGIDRDNFIDYVDREVIDTYPDGEGGYDVDYSDDWDIDDEVLTDYINDNASGFKVGQGLDAWESGDFDLVKVDDELKQELLDMYDKDPMVLKTLGGLNENETEDEKMARIKSVLAQRRADSQKYEDEYFKRRDVQNRLNTNKANKAEKGIGLKSVPAPEPKKPIGQHNIFGGIDEMGTGGAMGGTNTASVGGQYTAPLSMAGDDSDVIKKTMPNVPVVKEDSDLGGGYTHFAIFKADGKIADGWDYTGVDNDDIKYYTKLDIIDNFPEHKVSEFKIVTRKSLEKNGINPSDTNNWYKPTMNETMDVAGAGHFQYDTPGGLTMDLGKKNPKTKAETKTQWAGGAFVDFNDCVKMNNKPAGTGCSAGAVDNVVKLKKTKGNVNAPSLGENKIYEAVAKKTGKTIDEVKAIITAKNNKG